MAEKGLPWSDPNSDPMGDMLEFIRKAKEQYEREQRFPVSQEIVLGEARYGD